MSWLSSLSIFLAALAALTPAAGQSNDAAKQPLSPPRFGIQETGSSPARPEREPGLYMTFVTGMGSIPCRLFEKEAPVTVRTIVGLAIGKKSYVDPRTKKTVQGKRFYDGLTIHRVVPSFMIQGGDPLGTGVGGPEGPGFPFQDEFVSSLRFDVPGRLAMANAGPRTNGSQFFITEAPAPYLNNLHTIFGQCENLDVVKAIARVPSRGERPLQPVAIRRVTVERVGPAPPNAPESLPRATTTKKGSSSTKPRSQPAAKKTP